MDEFVLEDEALIGQNIRLIAQEWIDTARLLGRTIPKPVREEAYA